MHPAEVVWGLTNPNASLDSRSRRPHSHMHASSTNCVLFTMSPCEVLGAQWRVRRIRRLTA